MAGTRNNLIVLLCVCLGCVLTSLYYGLQEPINDDDVHGLNSIWLVAHGKLPYLDFAANHFPGMWIWLSPAALMVRTGSEFLLAARVFTSVLAGLAVWWAARAIRVTAPGSLLLGLGFVWVIRKTDFFLFRAEYIAACLLFLHIFLLGRISAGGDRLYMKLFWAAVPLAVAVSMSLRPAVFLAVEPVVIVGSVDRRHWARALMAWIAGLSAGVAPVIVYLSCLKLWPTAWYWSVEFVTSPVYYRATGGAMKLGVFWGWTHVAYLLAGIFLFLGVRWNSRLTRSVRVALLATWGAGLIFILFNPYSMAYAYVHIFLLAVTWLTVALFGWLERFPVPGWFRYSAGALLLGALVAALSSGAVEPRFDRSEQAAQLAVVDWLADVAGAETVVCIPPYHPIVKFDATYLQDSWQYAKHLAASDVFRKGLAGFGEILLTIRPPVIAADPWPTQTKGRDLIAWLLETNIVTAGEAVALRQMIEEHYDVVYFPLLAASSVSRFGSRFWVRKDRLRECGHPWGGAIEDG